MRDWQPMDSAPRDGRVLELYRPPPTENDGCHWVSRVYAIWHDLGDGWAWIWPDDTCVDIFDETRRGWIDNDEFFTEVECFTHWREPGEAPQ